MACDNGYFAAVRYKSEGLYCTSCAIPTELIVFLVVILLLGIILIYYASKSSFNWGAITISVNFLQVTAIFVDFQIEWPPQVLYLLAYINIFRIEISSLSPECFGTVNWFQTWLMMVLLPVFLLASMLFAASLLHLASWLMSKTRWPLWFKRKFSRFLKPPKVQDVSDMSPLADKLLIRLRNARRKWRFSLLSIFTTPVKRERVEEMYDQIWNTLITFLSIFYMTACSRSMEALICQEDDFVLAADPSTGETSLLPLRKMLTYSKKKVTCELRELGPDNRTLTEWRWSPSQPATSTALGKLGILATTPSYEIIFILGWCFTLLYAVGIPLFFAMRLYNGRHQLNHLRFGRKYGYLYKRYDVDWYFWEITIMARKILLSMVRLCLVLPNGEPLGVQQVSLGMLVMLIFLCAQAFALPYSEGHLDVLETALLTVNYIFLFIGLCNYLIERQSEYASDRELSDPLEGSLMFVLIVGVAFIIFFITLDVTLQLVRLYYRFIEGEGKYGGHQLLVLHALDKDRIRLQGLGVRFIASQRRQQFQQWLNGKATEEERLLLRAAFFSLAYFIEANQRSEVPKVVSRLLHVPIVGSAVNWLWRGSRRLGQRTEMPAAALPGGPAQPAQPLPTSAKKREVLRA